jgi:hypothetical protein
MKSRVLRNTSRALLISLGALWLPVAPVQATLVDTAAVVAPASSAAHQQVRDFLSRDDVRDLLVQQGLDLQAALARVDAMTEAEAQQVASELEQLPAGGSVIGVLFTVFIILLVTDILGLTKVFPFTRPVR